MTHIRMIAAENALRVMRFWFGSDDKRARTHISFLQDCLIQHLRMMIVEDVRARKTDEMHRMEGIAAAIEGERIDHNGDIDGIAKWLGLTIPPIERLMKNQTRRLVPSKVFDGFTCRSVELPNYVVH